MAATTAASGPSVGFIGGGMMASALIGGFVKSRAVPSAKAVAVAEPFKPLREKHEKAGYFATSDNVA